MAQAEKEKYAAYRETAHWQQLRVLCHARYNKRCVICSNGKTLQCHHWIYRKTFEETTVDDLVLLCDSCHGMVHSEGANKLTPDQLLSRYGKMEKPWKEKKKKPTKRKMERGRPSRIEMLAMLEKLEARHRIKSKKGNKCRQRHIDELKKKLGIAPIVRSPKIKVWTGRSISPQEAKFRQRFNRLTRKQRKRHDPNRQREIDALSVVIKSRSADIAAINKKQPPPFRGYKPAQNLPVYDWETKQWKRPSPTT